MIGSTIAHYRITAKLGEGGMGIVYRASDTKLDRDVAIKVLPPEVANEPDRLARFEREAKTLAPFDRTNLRADDVTSDGSRFVMAKRAPESSDLPPITVIFNWPKLLERK